jgi:mutator protein MutT
LGKQDAESAGRGVRIGRERVERQNAPAIEREGFKALGRLKASNAKRQAVIGSAAFCFSFWLFAFDPMSDPREYPTQPIIGVGVVVQKDDSVLLIQRGQEPGRGMWSLPGGGVELGEHLEQAAVREVREECGIEIALGHVIEAFDLIVPGDHGKPKFHYVIIDFAARYLRGNVRAASDVMDARWVLANELGQYALAEKTRQVLRKALAKE